MAAHCPRIVSLVHAGTEMLFALGAGPCVHAVSHACDFPAEVAGLARGTRSFVDAWRDAGTIDRQVRDRLRAGLPLYELDLGLLARLAPDLVVTQSQCGVCALDQHEVSAAADAIGFEVMALSAASLEGVLLEMETLAGWLSRHGVATCASAVEGLRERVQEVERLAAARAGTRPRMLVVEWFEPLMSAGHWSPEMVRKAGGMACLAREGAPSPTISVEAVAAAAPEVVVAAPCGFDLRRAREEADRHFRDEIWRETPAGRTGRLFVADGNGLFNRAGPRLVETLELMAACVAVQGEEWLPPRFDGRAERWRARG